MPTVVYQTEHQKIKETEFVTHVLTQLLTSTYTKSIVVPRKSYVTQVSGRACYVFARGKGSQG